MDRQDIIRRIAATTALITPKLGEYEALIKETKGKGENGADRPFTAEEMTKHVTLGKEINVLNSSLSTDKGMLKALDLSNASDDATAEQMNLPGREKLPQASDEYFEKFQALGRVGFNAARMDPEQFKALSTVSPSTGAVLIPTVIEQAILMEAASLCPLMRISGVEMTSTIHGQIPFMGELGVLAPRKETEAYAGYDPTLSAKAIDIYNYGGLFPVSQEIMDDAAGLPGAFARVWGRAYASTIEEYGWKGTGGQTAFFNQAGGAITVTLAGRVCPGIRTQNSTVVPVVVALAAAAVAYDDVVKLKQAVVPEARAGGVYVISTDFETKALLLKDTTGRPIWTPSMIAGQPAQINGSPYEVSSKLDAATTGLNPAFFGNFKQGHRIAVRKGLTIKTSEHYLFGNGMIAVAGDVRWGSLVEYNAYLARLNMA
ncbi:phage major capsid protein [Luteolibacter soli]|uniref:Phage major capsid protein n=1 Tax=Luteolibacter soli TaxID=3135280 RepID=A0ABU9B191_9BACT